MTVAEMHIAINQGLQKIGSFHADNFLPEEIDLELNKQILRFVEQRYNKKGNKYQTGFEESQKRIDDLRSLVVEYSQNTNYKGQIGPKHYIDSFTLPIPVASGGQNFQANDYLHLLNVRALVEYSGCEEVDWDHEYTLDFCECSISPATYTTPTTCDANGGVWLCVHFQSGNRIVGTYLRDDNGNLIYDVGGALTLNAQKSTTSSRCTFAQHDDIFTLLKDPFNTTTFKKPLYTIIGNNLDIYTDNTFVVPTVKITYLRYPAVVDSVTVPNVNCDLPLHTHQEIVDKTVNSLLEAISDPRYQTQSVEVLKSE